MGKGGATASSLGLAIGFGDGGEDGRR